MSTCASNMVGFTSSNDHSVIKGRSALFTRWFGASSYTLPKDTILLSLCLPCWLLVLMPAPSRYQNEQILKASMFLTINLT